MSFLEIYAICAAVAFVIFTIIGAVAVHNANSVFKVDIYGLSIIKLVLAAVFFPVVIIVGVIYGIVELAHPNER